jgi:hypothetical protein
MKICKKMTFPLMFMVLLVGISIAQKNYVGEAASKNDLLKILRLHQFKTSDIVAVINEQGVDFRLTPDIQTELVKAGARPELIEAVRGNFRGVLPIRPVNSSSKIKPEIPNQIVKPDNSNSYEGLIKKAINQYETDSNARMAIETLNQAVSLNPNKPRAYQMLGFINLYGLENFKTAEDYMRKAINAGGSAVFRLKHSHDKVFLTSCSGSFYISRAGIRYEDDENIHTFNVTDSNIVKIETGSFFNKLYKLKGGTFNVVIRDRSDQENYQFSPKTGKTEEAKMIIRLVGKN